MRRDLLLALAVATVALAVCGLGSPADMTVPASVQWVFSMGPDPNNLTPPLVQQDRVYIARRGILHCLDALTGAEQWKFQPNPGDVSTGPVASGELIIVGGTDSMLYGLNSRTGAVVWKLGCTAPIAPTPIIVNDLLMLGASQMVYAVNPATGQARWIGQINAPTRYGPVSDGSMIYFVGQDSSVQSMDAVTGRYRWGAQLVKGPEFLPPLAGAGRVIVTSGDRVYGVARSGGVSYTAQLPVGVGGIPTLVDENMYVPAVDGSIYILSQRSGAAVGLKSKPPYKVDHPLSSSPCVTESLVITGSADGLVIALDRQTGTTKWVYRSIGTDQLPDEPASHGFAGPMQCVDGSLFAVTGGGDLYRFSDSAPDSSGPVFGDFGPEPGSAQPGERYQQMTCSIIDVGSGVDPASIKLTVDGRPVQTEFDVTDGRMKSQSAPISDGTHIAAVSAKDFRGNEASAEWSFMTDAALVPKVQSGLPGAGGRQGMGGGGMRGGARGGGGMGGGRGGRGGGMGGGMGGRGGRGGGGGGGRRGGGY